ncbi:hypothetical protein [Evansella cellulosilytica]|uniref:Topology modulation protein n=1 Tax=Evansella cellulosilytica (strain ATCC 21833 / DSM 2522 / FERM P-1141 / JCM 9156 / N-4) TaxID=649639 RepID=E6TZZ7_EVAC2|nr:hypothetical protein [Evansella cellulosilytica]ADU29001.1 hypothetical protein Bcell_0720 [Evansella cellulosilytica DSM 2522]
MKRILVMGVSAGVGKSTLSKQLGKALGINVYHLDAYFWKPNWIEAPLEEFSESQREIVVKDKWIIDGNYTNTYDIREEHADTIVYIELPLHVCLFRVFNRWRKNIGRTRDDMGADCKEKLDFAFIKFIISTYHRRKKVMKNRLENFKKSNPHQRKTIVLKDKKSIEQFIKDINDKGVFIE